MKKKKIQWGQYFMIAAFMLIGGICGILMVRVAEELGGGLPVMVLFFILMYVIMLLQIAVHEAGHLVFGLLSGYKFCSYRLFSLMLIKDGERLRLRRFSLAGTGGQCLMEPPKLIDGEIPVVLYNLGGSLMNLIVSAVSLLIYFLSPQPFLSASMLLCSVIGFVFALMNGIPLRMGEVDNDGYNARALRRDKAALRAFWVQMMISAETARGKRLRDRPEEWFGVPSDEAMKNSMLATLGVFACNRLMDEQRFQEADALMERMMSNGSGMAGLYRGLMLCDRMCVELLSDGRAEIIDGWLTKEQKKLMKAMKTYPGVIRTEYVLALLHHKDASAAEKVKRRFEKCARTYPYPGDIESERELMERADRAS